MTFIALLSYSCSIVTASAGGYHLWPPPQNAIFGLTLLLVAMMFPPAGLLLDALSEVIRDTVKSTSLTLDEKREALGKLMGLVFEVFKNMKALLPLPKKEKK